MFRKATIGLTTLAIATTTAVAPALAEDTTPAEATTTVETTTSTTPTPEKIEDALKVVEKIIEIAGKFA
mgnify:CR=1 FL=1